MSNHEHEGKPLVRLDCADWRWLQDVLGPLTSAKLRHENTITHKALEGTSNNQQNIAADMYLRVLYPSVASSTVADAVNLTAVQAKRVVPNSKPVGCIELL